MKEFLTDLLTTFPECKDSLTQGSIDILTDNFNTDDINELHKYMCQVFPERFFDILYKRTEIFDDDEVNTCFLPGIDFSALWKENISDKTRDTIWNYLQLILFSISGDITNGNGFGDTAKLFEAIDENELKKKLEETLKDMTSMFNIDGLGGMSDLSGVEGMGDMDLSGVEKLFEGMEEGMKGMGMDFSGAEGNFDMPDADELHQHINKLLDGNLGRLAKEIAKETAEELEEDMGDINDVGEVFQKLFKNPGKLMNMVKTVGKKLDSKIKSGEIKESELIKETSDLFNEMKNMPGMKNMEKMLGKWDCLLEKLENSIWDNFKQP